uniref:Uncharacterized protein n=1 Tax=Trichobilharzia regenti TaxID=157069 RepID=A0AA85K1X7_TRIRE|nr:unnamed protein product [Trichobilharzia regenti]
MLFTVGHEVMSQSIRTSSSSWSVASPGSLRLLVKGRLSQLAGLKFKLWMVHSYIRKRMVMDMWTVTSCSKSFQPLKNCCNA